MKRILTLFLAAILLSSCSASWHIKKAKNKCPECFSDSIIVEYKDSIIYRDTLINISFQDFLEVDTVPEIKYDTVFVDKVKKILPSFDTIILEKNGLKTNVSMFKGRLFVRTDVDSSYIFELKDSIKILNKETTKTETVIVKEKSTIKQIFIYVVIALAIILLIILFKK